MGTHIREAEDERGDLIEILYFCSRGCALDSTERPQLAEFGEPAGAPCAESEPGVEQDVWCAGCGVLMASPDKEPPVVVNLIDREIGEDGVAIPQPYRGRPETVGLGFKLEEESGCKSS